MPILRRTAPVLAVVGGLVIAACAGTTAPTTGDLATPSDGPTTTKPSDTEASTTAPQATAASTTGASASEPSSTTPTSAATTSDTTVQPTSTTSATSTTSTPPPTTSASTATPATIPIRIRLDRRVGDPATEGFAALVEQVLTDPRGWSQAGFDFSFDDSAFDYTVVLAEGPEVDELCLPYDTFGRFSCQIGPTVALNADRWRSAVDSWPASLDEYRTMLVNHEVGHLIGQHHPATRCPGDGQRAPVMAQQSSGVAPCLANPWPLPWEITCAASGLEPLAPPFERNINLTCGPDGPIG